MPEVLNRKAILQRATKFAHDWKGETSERGESQTFWNDFLNVFGVTRRQVATFEYEARRRSTGALGRVDVLWPGYIAVEQKSAGKRLDTALAQLQDYLLGLPAEALPKLAVVCDFERFKGRDLDSGDEFEFKLAELPSNLERFLYLAGHDRRGNERTEEEVNLHATDLLADLHDALADSGYAHHNLRQFLVRLLFILFADDTDVWERGLFHYMVAHKTRSDGSDLGPTLSYLFQILDTARDRRSKNIDPDLNAFEYINGALFSEQLPIPACDAAMRDLILRACGFDWSKISPAIFGSMFQDVMTAVERRQLGAHYTTEPNILRTIKPLFLDVLELELEAATTRPALERFRDKLGTLTFFDPACGCGNFLIIAYREIRRLEMECLRRLRALMIDQRRRDAAQLTVDVSFHSRVRVGQFYGIEIEEFPARIAETAMYLMDHLANRELSAEFGEYYVRFPITDTANIRIDNATRIDWNDVLASNDCSYLFGNPPFSGQYNRTAQQTEDLQLVWGKRYNGYLDYVTAWYIKAIEYVGGRSIKIAFVSTNSICQGEPVAPLWEPILQAGFHIDFAHRTFTWISEARGAAGVHVVIIGFSRGNNTSSKWLFEYPVYGRGEPKARQVRHINPYLVEGPDVLVRPRNQALARDLPRIHYGSKIADGGFLLVTAAQVEAVRADPQAAKYLRPFIGARELVHGEQKWCLWMEDINAADIRASRILRERIDGVRRMREASNDREINDAAARPAQFLRNMQPKEDYLAIPRHVGESRLYFPVGYYGADVITGDHNFVAPDPDGYLLGLLSSSIFMTWMRTVSGRIRADLRFSKTITWHNFPLPDVDESRRRRVIDAGKAVMSARRQFPDRSLARLYDHRAMPGVLVNAHLELDKVVNACFSSRRRMDGEADRQTILFERFQELITEEQMLAASAAPARRSKR